MTPQERPRPSSVPPPSFTPQSGRPARPSVRDTAIEVGDTGAAPPAPSTGAPAAQPPARRPSTASSGMRAPLSSNAPRSGSAGRIPATPRSGASPSPERPASFAPSGQPAGARPAAGGPPRPTREPAGGSARPPLTAPPRTAGGGRSSTPGGPGGPTGPRPGAPGGPLGAAPVAGRRTRPRWGRIVALGLCLLLVLAIAWPVGLLLWANGKINHIEALSGAASTAGTTYLLAGSDSRADGAVGDDGTTGARTDTIMLLHVPDSGPTSLISLPRDAYVDIPGNSANKLNAAFSWGGAPLLVQTVEGMTGMTVDHYIEIGFSGVETIVDAVGGVELCLDYDVNDPNSGLVWTAGCHMTDGTMALAFSRMRYADPQGDIGRAERQRQVISAVSSALQDKSILVKPGTQRELISSGLDVLTVDEGTNIIDLGKMALAFRAANGPGGVTGTPPLSSLDYRPGNVGSAVQLDAERGPQFWADIRDGAMPAGVVGGMPQ